MKNLIYLPLLFVIFVTIVLNSGISAQLSCKDENNRDVDWFINYKLPKIDAEKTGSDLRSGRAYAYLTPSQSSKWTLSSTTVDSPNSMLGRTWQEFANKKKSSDTTYLFYNDDSPVGGSSAVGHLKGFLAFDDTSGFWLTHSIPRFGEVDKYEYPSSALTNGQTAMCITFKTTALNDICNHLLYCNPNIYSYKLSDSVRECLDNTAKTIFTEKPAFIRKAPFTRESIVKSLDDEEFFLFAKDNQFKYDIYNSLVAPGLESSLLAETWRRGSGTNLPTYCRSGYSVINIDSIGMSVSKEDEISFKYTEDHSKWAISAESQSPWVCIGDLNRMLSQARRGGGAVCFESRQAWKAFRNIIDKTESCSV